MIQEVLCHILETCIDALVEEDSIAAWGYLEQIKEILDEFDFTVNEIPEEVRIT